MISPSEYRSFSRMDYYTFVHRSFRELNPNVPFLHNWHNELIAAKLEACFRGEINRLIVERPTALLEIAYGNGGFPRVHPGASA